MATHEATVSWERGGANFTDLGYSRAHTWRFDGGICVPASASPAHVPRPHSVDAAVDPEEAFVAALSSCHMLWFLFLAAEAGWKVDSYEDAALGTMGRNADGRLAMVEVVLRPRITFTDRQPTLADVEGLHEVAHHRCYLANSVTTNIRIEPRSSTR